MTNISKNINLADRCQCTGCGACVSVCPIGSITMREDKEGFLQPNIDVDTCIACHICEKTCPILNPLTILHNFETQAYAAQLVQKDELFEVSSGGAFWALAQTILDKGGIVYGVAQISIDKVQHIRVDNIEAAKKLRRSKYLPSDIHGVYDSVKNDLKKGLLVLFSGVGCQIAGLLAFLHNDYENLITCDVVCHGIPSIKVWKAYIKEKEKTEGKKIVSVIFRDKSKGWSHNQYKITYADGCIEQEDSTVQLFHHGYLKGLFYRRSCGTCQFACLPRLSDITLADFWKYMGELRVKDWGVSLVCVNSQKGYNCLIDASKYLKIESSDRNLVIDSCRHLTHAPIVSQNRENFFKEFDRNGYYSAANKYIVENRKSEYNLLKKAKRIFNKILHYSYKKTNIHDRDIIKSYYSDLGCNVFFAESAGEFFKLLFCRKKTLVSANGIMCRIAKIIKIKTIRPEIIIFKAQQVAAIKDAFLLLSKKQIPVFFYHRTAKDKEFVYSPSAVNRMENDLSFPKMYEDIDRYFSDLQELLGCDITKEYVEDLGKISQVIWKGNFYCHEDIVGKYVNVVNGKRLTCNQPSQFKRTLHIYGRCGAFGYAVEDKDTLPSQIQLYLNNIGIKDICVVNHGLWGGSDENIIHNFLLDSVGMKEGDLVLFYQHRPELSVLQQWENRGVWYKNITQDWHLYKEASWCFYNYPGHMNAVGYKNAAEIICKDLMSHNFGCRSVDNDIMSEYKADSLNGYLKAYAHNSDFDDELNRFIRDIVFQYPIEKGERCGAIVMNCNPFTFGHRYLIEKASAEVDRLYIFVVEEDKSFFRFNDRFEMVKNGTSDLRNVCVVPSGNFIISAFTFPEYFMKDYVKEKEFDMSSDVEIFANKIAPALHITKRFVGEEPFDVVTGRYNETMKNILPQYGIEFIEIPRFSASGTVINATMVRQLLAEKNFDEISKFVPDSTLQILKERYSAN